MEIGTGSNLNKLFILQSGLIVIKTKILLEYDAWFLIDVSVNLIILD